MKISEESIIETIDELTEQALEVVHNREAHTYREYEAVMFALGLMVQKMYMRHVEKMHRVQTSRQLRAVRSSRNDDVYRQNQELKLKKAG